MTTWQPMDSAPRDGTTIELNYGTPEQPDVCLAMWSDRPVCMLGARCGGFPPGWATAGNDTDRNLPLSDPPNSWRPAPCDHTWKWIDDSFDHEHGTERICFWRCEHCDLERPATSSDYHDPESP